MQFLNPFGAETLQHRNTAALQQSSAAALKNNYLPLDNNYFQER